MQQINLLQSGLRSKESRLAANKVVTYLGMFIAVLGMISAFQWWQQYSQQQALLEAKQAKDELLKKIQVVSTEIAAVSDDSEYKNILIKKEQELKNKNLVLSVLSGQKFGNTKGFADQFTGLSRQHVDGLWITHLDIHAGGEKLNLQGSTFSPGHVPDYLQRLGKEPSFNGVEFKTFLMERDEGSSRINFDIRSTQKEAG